MYVSFSFVDSRRVYDRRTVKKAPAKIRNFRPLQVVSRRRAPWNTRNGEREMKLQWCVYIMRVFPRRREFLSPFSPILPFFLPFFSKPCRILCSPRFPACCFPSSFHPAFFSLFPFLLHDSVFAFLRCKPRYARKRKLYFWWNRSNFFEGTSKWIR